MSRDIALAIAAVERRLAEIAREARLLRNISRLLRKYDDVEVGRSPTLGEILGPGGAAGPTEGDSKEGCSSLSS